MTGYSNPAEFATQAWNVMGGQIDWAALPFLVELYDVDDVEVFISELVAIREYMRKSDAADGNQSTL